MGRACPEGRYGDARRGSGNGTGKGREKLTAAQTAATQQVIGFALWAERSAAWLLDIDAPNCSTLPGSAN